MGYRYRGNDIVSVRLAYAERQKLDEMAARESRNRSEVLRELIRLAPLPEPRQRRLD